MVQGNMSIPNLYILFFLFGRGIVRDGGLTQSHFYPPYLRLNPPIMTTTTEIPIHLRETEYTELRLKSPPSSSKIPVPFAYAASDDGTDENLLLLFHGLGKPLLQPRYLIHE